MPTIKLDSADAPDAHDDIHSWKSAYRSNDALPCPFCGDAPMIVPWHGGGPRKRMIMCRSDACSVGPQVTGATERQAIEKWNTRS